MKCQAITDDMRACDNEARYLDEHGQLMCGTCPIKYGADSLRYEDVGRLISWARQVLNGGAMGGSSFTALRSIMGRKPEPPISIDGPSPVYFDVPGDACQTCKRRTEECICACPDLRCERGRHDKGPHMARHWDEQLLMEVVTEWT